MTITVAGPQPRLLSYKEDTARRYRDVTFEQEKKQKMDGQVGEKAEKGKWYGWVYTTTGVGPPGVWVVSFLFLCKLEISFRSSLAVMAPEYMWVSWALRCAFAIEHHRAWVFRVSVVFTSSYLQIPMMEDTEKRSSAMPQLFLS